MPAVAARILEQCVRALLEYGAEVNAVDNNGVSARMVSAWLGLEPSVITLLEAGADRAQANSHGRTAKVLALTRGHNEIAEMLTWRMLLVRVPTGPLFLY